MFTDWLLVERTNVRHIDGEPDGKVAVNIAGRWITAQAGAHIRQARREAAWKRQGRDIAARRKAGRRSGPVIVRQMGEAARLAWIAANETTIARFGRDPYGRR